MWRYLIFLAVFLLSACQEDIDKRKTFVYISPDSSAISISTAKVVKQAVPRFYSSTGYTSIARQVEVSTSQAGTIKMLKVNEGDIIKAGALLIIIDESELVTMIKTANAAIHQAKISRNDRQHDFNTAQKLVKKRIIPAEKFRKTQVQLQLAVSQLSQAYSELKRLKARKPYYRITSPIKARVIKKWVNQGDLAVAGKPLLQLEALDGLEFETALPVKWLSKIHIGDKYKLHLHGSNDSSNNSSGKSSDKSSDKSLPVRVSHIIRTANRITQTCKIKLALPKSSKLTAGLSGQINFHIANEKHLLIPETALIKRAGVQGVFVVSDNINSSDASKKGKAYFTPVKTERRWKKKWLVLSGLKEGDSVVLNPSTKLLDGTSIKVVHVK